MSDFSVSVQVRWSDLDPNFHLRHSVYYDWGAYCRIRYMHTYGLTATLMQQLHFGPILFREECVFKKEIHLNDAVSINLVLMKSRRDFSRWTMQHSIYKHDGILCAVITVDGAWLDTSKRKLATPPEEVVRVFEQIPHSNQFSWDEVS
jgi:acyl-CoA thioester hydrolase